LAAIAMLLAADTRAAALRPRLTRAAFPAIGLVAWATAAVLWAPHGPWSAWIKVFLVVVAAVVLADGLKVVPPACLKQFAPRIATACLALLLLLLIERATEGYFIHLVRNKTIPDLLFNVLAGGLTALCSWAFPVAYILWRKTGRWHVAAAFPLACFFL